MEEAEILNRILSLRTAIACVLGTLTKEQQKEAFARMTQIQISLEEARDGLIPGCAAAVVVMEEEFDAIRRASTFEPTYVQSKAAPAKRTRRPRAAK